MLPIIQQTDVRKLSQEVLLRAIERAESDRAINLSFRDFWDPDEVTDQEMITQIKLQLEHLDETLRILREELERRALP
jgi:hypothetical protein